MSRFQEAPSEHLFYMAPLQPNGALIRALGILSHNCVQAIRSRPGLAEFASSIADPLVNSRRHWRLLGEKTVHDFVPFYWCTHTPMQYVVTVKNATLAQDELVFFVRRRALASAAGRLDDRRQRGQS